MAASYGKIFVNSRKISENVCQFFVDLPVCPVPCVYYQPHQEWRRPIWIGTGSMIDTQLFELGLLRPLVLELQPTQKN